MKYTKKEPEVKIGQIYLLTAYKSALFLRVTGYTKTGKSVVFAELKNTRKHTCFLGGGSADHTLDVDKDGEYIEECTYTIPKRSYDDGFFCRKINGTDYSGGLWDGKTYTEYDRD
jgi:hypothetical protein